MTRASVALILGAVLLHLIPCHVASASPSADASSLQSATLRRDHWAYKAVARARAQGLLIGDEGLYPGASTATRAQFAVLVDKMLERINARRSRGDAISPQALQDFGVMSIEFAADLAALRREPPGNGAPTPSATVGVRSRHAHFEITTNRPSQRMSTEQEILAIKGAVPPPRGASPAKLQIKTLFYGDISDYGQTGFGPQFLTQVNPPGPGNGGYSAFDITRAYLNFYFSPDERWTLRITPNIYRAVGTPGNDKSGSSAGIGNNIDGDLNYRLKYAYVDFNDLFVNDARLKGAKATFGQQMNPLVDWEEHLYGYRFTSLVPWNYLSLSSTRIGISVHGPIRSRGRAKPVADYDVGVFNETSFRGAELSDRKQLMGRLSYYPAGFEGRSKGFGITGFGDWGDTNVTPDTDSAMVYRTALIVHGSGDGWGLAGEMDDGRNAFTSNNLFSGSGPADQFGVGVTPFAGTDALAKAFLDNPKSHQRGYDVFGHVRVGHSPFDVFGLVQWMSPNIHVARDPFDLRRSVFGLGYQAKDFLRFALDTQTLVYTHDPLTVSAAELAPFSASLAGTHPGGITTTGLSATNALFLHMELFY